MEDVAMKWRQFGRLTSAMVLIFAAWAYWDWLVHGRMFVEVLLYQSDVWDSPHAPKLDLIPATTLAQTIIFILIYQFLIAPKSIKLTLLYGFLYGLLLGISTGYRNYIVLPLPGRLAVLCLLGSVVQGLAGSVVLALILRPRGNASPADRLPAEEPENQSQAGTASC
jgi:hypothetical protein